MKTQILYDDMQLIKAYYCGKCGRISYNQDATDRCCVCIECGKEIDHKFSNLSCTPCRDAGYQKREAERLNRAEEVTDIAGIECFYHEDKFFFGEEDVADYLYDLEEEDRPEWIFPCKKKAFLFDMADAVESYAMDECNEDYHFADLDKMVEHFNDWCKKQPCSYDPIMTKKISSKLFLEDNNDTTKTS